MIIDNLLERGIIYCVYERTVPFKETDLAKLQQMKEDGRKFICKKAICKCGRKKESKRMFTAVCGVCSKALSRHKHEDRYKTEIDELKQEAKGSNGNSIWL